MDKISIIVPCWNEEAALPIYYKEMSRIIGQMDTDVELIFVDDGSADKTLEEMRQQSMRDLHMQKEIILR